MTLVEPDEVDDLDLGRPPRPPLSPRLRRALAGGLAMVAAGAVTAFVLLHPGDDVRAPAGAASPVIESSAGFAAGPILVRVDGRDALQPPGLPGLGASVQPVPLDPDPATVAVVAAALPGFRDVRGGRISGDTGRFGVYLAGNYDGPGGATIGVTLYTVRSPGTTFGANQFVSRTRFDNEYSVRTDVSVFTGTGWWVHVVSLGPDDPSAQRTGETARLLPLAENPALVTT